MGEREARAAFTRVCAERDDLAARLERAVRQRDSLNRRLEVRWGELCEARAERDEQRERAERAEAAIAAVRELHAPRRDRHGYQRCTGCIKAYPCVTIRALDAAPTAGQPGDSGQGRRG